MVIILASGAAFAQARTPTGASGGVIYTQDGSVAFSASWGVQLTQAPGVSLKAEGLLASDGRYGVALVTPVATVTDPLGRALKLNWGDAFQAIANHTSFGPALLTDKPDWKAVRLGIALEWQALDF
jgi:hypothetical protein